MDELPLSIEAVPHICPLSPWISSVDIYPVRVASVAPDIAPVIARAPSPLKLYVPEAAKPVLGVCVVQPAPLDA